MLMEKTYRAKYQMISANAQAAVGRNWKRPWKSELLLVSTSPRLQTWVPFCKMSPAIIINRMRLRKSYIPVKTRKSQNREGANKSRVDPKMRKSSISGYFWLGLLSKDSVQRLVLSLKCKHCWLKNKTPTNFPYCKGCMINKCPILNEDIFKRTRRKTQAKQGSVEAF